LLATSSAKSCTDDAGAPVGFVVDAFFGKQSALSSTYNKMKAGTINSTARPAATSTAVIVPDGAAAASQPVA
jgi:hypothetical protein